MSKTAEEFKNSLKGVAVPLICPYTEKGEVDVEGIKENTKFLLDFAKEGNKHVTLLANGNTQQFYANSIEEQKKVIKTVVDTVAGQLLVIAGVSQAAARQTIQMAKYAEEVGADCALVVLPYYQQASKEGMYQYYKTVAESVNIGIMIYNDTNVSGLMLPSDVLARLAKIENIVAIKDITPNAGDYAFNSLMIDPKDMVLFNGKGPIFYLASAAYGFRYRGFFNACEAFTPLDYDIYEAVEARNFEKATEVLRKQWPFWRFVGKVGSSRKSISVFPDWMRTSPTWISIAKCAMNLTGLRGGLYHPGQLPIEELTDEEKQELKGVLKKMGLI